MYSVAVFYLIAAAGAIQLVDSIVPSTRLPDWSDEFFLALIILGFPIALVLAWIFEAGPEGVRRTEPRPDPSEPHASGSPGGNPVGALEGATADAPPDAQRQALGAARPDAPDTAPEEQPPGQLGMASQELDERHVAVLPFDLLSGTDDARPLAVGLHDDLLTELSRVSGLRVISRTSVKGYRDTKKSVREIARELGVGTLVEGGVQSAGGRIRLNIQLIDARRDTHRWAETFDRELNAANIFEIQSELASLIVGSLRAELNPAERERLLDRSTTGDLDAFRLAALGREELDRRTEDGMRRAVDYFRQATERDPDYTLAWVGLGDAFGLLVSYGHDERADGIPRAEQAIRRALALDPESAEAHASLGLIRYLRQQGRETIQALQRAIELRPGYAEAHNWLAWVSTLLGLRELALESARRATELDPRSVEPVSNLSAASLMNGLPDDALREARRVRDLEPSWETGPFLEAMALCELGRHREAIALLKALELPWAGSGLRGALGVAHAGAGDEAEAREILAGLDPIADAFAVGLIHASLGERDAAFEAFEHVVDWSDWSSMAVHTLFPSLWPKLEDDPRYPELLRATSRAWGMESPGHPEGS